MTRFWSITLLGLGFSGAVAAQTITGTVTGTVVDATGGAIPSAAVSLIHEGTGVERRIETNESGVFVFAAIPPGTYTVKVEKAAFRALSRTGLVLTANQRLSLGELRMEVGQTAESITVRAEAAVLQTESSQTAAVISNRQLDKMVIRGREVMNLLRILPGVSQGSFNPGGGELAETDNRFGSQALGGAFGSSTPIVVGLRASSNTVTVDGQSGNDADIAGAFNGNTSVDAIAEVKVVLNNYDAEYGRNAGSQVNIVSKSGTRDVHGSAYWFKRHEQFNANDFFNNRQGIAKPLYRYNTFGATIGGPIYVPRHFNTGRDRAFFFFSHENWLIKQPAGGIRQITVPTEAERAGDFRQSPATVRDPSTGQPFPNNIIPGSRIHRGGQALLNIFPLPNALNREVTRGAYNYEWQNVQEIPKIQNMLKLDFLPSSKDTLTLRGRQYRSDVRGFGANASFINTNWPIVEHHYLFTESSVNASWTRVLRPTLVNEFSAGMRGLTERGTLNSLTDLTRIQRASLGVTLPQFNPEINPLGIIPQATFGGVQNPVNIAIDGRFPIDAGDNRFTFSDNLSWIRGEHSLKFGAYFERNWASEGRRANQFSGSYDFGHDANNPLNTGYAFSNALLGSFRTYLEQDGFAMVKSRNALFEWFAQDTWKTTRTLTLNFGVRFSLYTPWTLRAPGAMFVGDRYDPAKVPVFYRPARDPQNRRVGQNPLTGEYVPAALIGAFVPNTGDPANGMVLASDPGYPPGFIDTHPVQVAPRVGFALDLFGNGRTAIRGGAGVTKQTMPPHGNYKNAALSPPVQNSPQIFYGNADTLLEASGVLFPSSVTAADRNPDTPTVYNYSFAIQQKLSRDTLVDVSYVGNVARHLLQSRNLNTLPYGARFRPEAADPSNPSTPLPDHFLRPIHGYANITYIENSGISNYNGLHVALDSRMRSSIQFGVAYTWSKAMGLTDGDFGNQPMYLSWRVWNYGKAGYDQTHKLSANFIYDLPRLAFSPLRYALGDWQVAGIATIASGLPYGIGMTTSDGADITGGGDGIRTVIVEHPILPREERSFDRWFNTSAFGRPPRGSFGNAPSDVYRGPGIHNYDLSVFKRFPIRGETTYLQFRGEFYNVFNHTQYQFVDNTARFNAAGQQINGRFGQVTATRLPRIIQFALNFYF